MPVQTPMLSYKILTKCSLTSLKKVCMELSHIIIEMKNKIKGPEMDYTVANSPEDYFISLSEEEQGA